MNCENVNTYLGDFIGRGAQGYICNHAFDEHKVIKVSNERPVNKLMGPHVIINEWSLAKKAGELGVSPRVYDFLICREPTEAGEKYKGYIVMDKIHGKTLTTSSEVLKYLPKIIKKMRILKEHNVYYTDFNAANIMIGTIEGSSSPRKQIYLIDYGACKEMDSDEIVIDETEVLEGLMYGVEGGDDYINSRVKKTSPAKSIPDNEEQRRRALAWRERLMKKKGGNTKKYLNSDKTYNKSIFTKKKTYKNKSTKITILP